MFFKNRFFFKAKKINQQPNKLVNFNFIIQMEKQKKIYFIAALGTFQLTV